MYDWIDDIERARQKCDATYVGPGGCYLPEYLEARREYHTLMVKAGQMDARAARNDAQRMQAEANRLALPWYDLRRHAGSWAPKHPKWMADLLRQGMRRSR